jgi:DNA-directed RNA polymerase beta' subunit
MSTLNEKSKKNDHKDNIGALREALQKYKNIPMPVSAYMDKLGKIGLSVLEESDDKINKKILGVELASPEKIRKWAERVLPTGKIVGAVFNANTIHHKTLKPIKGGLFCERIFGPTKDFRCACGKSITKQNSTAISNSPEGICGTGTSTDGTYIKKALFCKICEVEYTSSLLRRYQLGYIALAFPVTHLWYTKGFSNPISLLLDIHKYDLDFIIYCNKITSIEKSVELTDIPVGKDPIELLELIKKSKKNKTNRKKAGGHTKVTDIMPVYDTDYGHRSTKSCGHGSTNSRSVTGTLRSVAGTLRSVAGTSLPLVESQLTLGSNILLNRKYKQCANRSTDSRNPIGIPTAIKQIIQGLRGSLSRRPKVKQSSPNSHFVGGLLNVENLRNMAELKRRQTFISSTQKRWDLCETSKLLVYNIYAIADDHLWDNLEDWNVIKSYITVSPSMIDALIPFYSQRIPSSTFKNPQLSSFNPTQAIYKYTKMSKGLYGYHSQQEPSRRSQKGRPRTAWPNKQMPTPETRVGITGRRGIVDSPLGVGAGVLNLFFTSLTPIELNAMDKQLSQLLRESRMNILLYKTKQHVTQIQRRRLHVKACRNPESFGVSLQRGALLEATTYWRPSKESRYSRIDIWMEKHYEILRRSKTIRKFSLAKILPEFMVLKILPVLPPELRPIRKGNDGNILTSDLNKLYQRVLFRNERLNNIILPFPEYTPNHGSSAPSSKVRMSPSESLAPQIGYEKHFTQRLLQEAIDNLIDNGRSGGNSEVDAKGRILKSLSEVLKGKQGRFRQYLLGKRVDYSGRSVIVVGPKLKIHQCGLPREMALELYLPFIIQYLIQMKYTRTVVGAKGFIAHQSALVATILDEIVQGHPIVLNRAPTLHRLGFQAFQPILVDGRAILLHPMACTAFNADFDGDQMAVHIPITIEARSEAWRLMLARNNLLSPATGEPILLPSQDMILGCYYLTTLKKMPANKNVHSLYYTSIQTVLNHYSLGKIHVHTLLWLKTKKIVYTEASKKPYEIRISLYGKIEEISKNCIYYSNQNCMSNINNTLEVVNYKYIRTTAGRILFNSILTRAYRITAEGS